MKKKTREFHALQHARQGWPVIPMHSVQNGRCTCGSDDCPNAGKHPRTAHGIKDSSKDPEQIALWWKKWPNANIGIVTGSASGLLVLDVDPRHDGDKSLKKLLGALDLPDTPTVCTGGGGTHFYFALPGDPETKSRGSILPGLDIKADGGVIIAPPSLHLSGKHYQWVHGLTPTKVKLSKIPSWLKNVLWKSRAKASANTAKNGNWVPQGKRHDFLVQMAGAYRRQGATPDEIEPVLTVINETRCNPPLAQDEVGLIARSADSWEQGAGSSPYTATEQGIFFNKTTNHGTQPVKLTNFDARIVTEIAEDDGVDVGRSFEIEITLHGQPKCTISVPVGDFSSMSWALKNLGAAAVVSPGFGARDLARAAIQELSTEVIKRKIYMHSGWRKRHGKSVYLHSGGAIGRNGPVTDVKVRLPQSLSHLELPSPPSGKTLKAAIRQSLKFLKLAPAIVTFPLYSGTWRAVLGQCDFALFLAGQTGVGKSELAALNQQHYGAGFDRLHLPASWSSTGNANEGLAFCAKDMLLVVDDFAPTGTQGDLARYNREADRLLRAQGNTTGRLRMKQDATLRSTKTPRGLILSNGEDVPRGQSLQARLFVIEVGPNALDWDLLSKCQRAAHEGIYSQVMAAYLQWLAPRITWIQKNLPRKLSVLRAKASGSAQHHRTPDIVANLMMGLKYFLMFAQKSGAISVDEADELSTQAWAALGLAAAAQSDHQSAENPALRFVELIKSALATDRAHLTDVETGSSNNAKGECIGWISDEYVYLNPDVAFATAQKLAKDQGEFIPISQKTLWQRMRDCKLLVLSEKKRNLARITINGQRRRRVVVLSHKTLGVDA